MEYFALGFYIAAMLIVRVLYNRRKRVRALSHTTSKATVNSILTYSKNHVPTTVKGKYIQMFMN